MKEINVIGTMQLLAACQRAETFRKLVVQSSISVYGASPRDPAKFTEDMSARAQPRTGFGKDQSRSRAMFVGWPGVGPMSSSRPCGWRT